MTNLEGRSGRTRGLAEAAGSRDVGSDAALVEAADLLLLVIVPSEARALAERLAPALASVATPPVVVDCNAVAPATSAAVGAIVEAAGAPFVDGGIIGPPPLPDSSRTRLYVSGGAVAARPVEILAGRRASARLDATQAVGRLRVTASTEGKTLLARVEVDGQLAGMTPAVLWVPAGREVEVRVVGTQRVEQVRLQLDPGGAREL
ncbi:MAG: hypothetical protein ACOCYE_14485, partial [Pseudomonadota bacterium]